METDNLENITEDEAELYDRQIRLWGLDAQRRLRAASVLIIGMKGLGAEVAKNIILAGVKRVTLMDPGCVEEEDRMSQFFVSNSQAGENRAEASLSNAQLLNPMVKVTAETEGPSNKTDDYFLDYDVICATCCPPSLLFRLDRLCFQNKIKFFCGDVYGFYGFSFTDLGSHDYVYEKVKLEKTKESENNSKSTETEATYEKQTMTFSRLEEEFNFNWSLDTPEMKKKIRQTPTAYFITRVYGEFMEQKCCRPSTMNKEADTKDLKNLRLQVLNTLGAPAKVIPEDFYQFGFGELSPVCAIVGGVLSQEIIKAVSQKDAPLNNFFFYNGTNDDGIVTKITQ